MKRITSLFLLIFLVCSMLISCDTEKEINPDKDKDHVADEGNENDPVPEEGHNVGNLAIDFPLEFISGEGKDSIKNHRGKVVVINFWGTWCDPCKSELPHFNQLAEEYSDDVVFFAIHSVQGIQNAPLYIKNNFSDSKMLFLKDVPLSASSESSGMYYILLGGIGYYPRTLVLDADGVITYTIDRAVSYDELKEEIDKALK